MSNIFPIGISRGGSDEGQSVPLSSDNPAVDTSNNTLQFASPLGFTGISGFTGILNTIQGITGLAYFGRDGIPGATGVPGSTGSQGLAGLTGYIGLQGSSPGVTGLQGITGSQSVTGAVGQTGLRGLTGLEGLQGTTGLIGISGVTGLTGGDTGIIGETGIRGNTGIETAATGFTGISVAGVTGLQGFTGLVGLTGLAGTAAISIDIGQDISATNPLVSSIITTTGQQIQFRGVGLLSDVGVTNTITLTLGTTTLFTIVSGSLLDSFIVEGLIVRTGASAQRIGAQFLFYSGLTYAFSTTAAESWASSPTLTLSVSASTGNYGVVELSSSLVEAS
jgi:hypothetical protein